MNTKSLCLGVLSQRPMSGYEIKKHFEDAFRHFFAAGYGSIYPALAELTARELVTVTSIEQEKKPDKKIYALTEKGHAELIAELITTPPRHKVRSEFLTLMFFAHLLPPDRVGEVIDDMINQWETVLHRELEDYEKHHNCGGEPLEPGQTFALGFGRTVLTAALAYVKRQKPGIIRQVSEMNEGAKVREDLETTELNAIALAGE